MRTREEIREERRKYKNDVTYEVWRNGGNMDRVNDDRVDRHYYYGADVDVAVGAELRVQRPHRPTEYEQDNYSQQPRSQGFRKDIMSHKNLDNVCSMCKGNGCDPIQESGLTRICRLCQGTGKRSNKKDQYDR